jgi:multiple antibiotic resistance protein
MFKNLMLERKSMINLPLVLQIFALINPLSSLPVLVVAYKRGLNVKEIALQATFIAFAIAVAIIALGQYIFILFNVGIDEFRVAGGVVLFLLGLSTARNSVATYTKADSAEAITSLIATPLLTGPAVISFITIKTYELGTFVVSINTFLSFVLVGVVFYSLSSLIPRINLRVVGILSRILGLFLLAVSIGMISTGIKGIFGI